ncbi:hypothetical protein ABXS71_06160 [Bacillus infantis]|uniref:hypothetical protein n=1 Tax=Bacillus infantis TaxID=324767 RepID=UPI003450F0BD
MQGMGTQSNPFLISTPQDLDNVRNNLTAYYELLNDIDMANWGNFNPIVKGSNYFKGQFNGKGYKIQNLTINQSVGNNGLFSVIDNTLALVKNVGLENCKIYAPEGSWTGAIVGRLSNGLVENCYSTGQIKGRYMVGGVVGQFNGGTVKDCFSHAYVEGLGRIGGLIGYIGGSSCKVINSYSTGRAVATEIGTKYLAQGLIGENAASATITNSYWDQDSSGLLVSDGGIGKTTSEMKQRETFVGWDFTSVWGIENGYPYLQVFGIPQAPPKTLTISLVSSIKNLHGGLYRATKTSKVLSTYSNAFQTSNKRYTATLRETSTYLSHLETNAEKFSRVVRSGNRNVYTYLNTIHSYVNRESKTVRNLIAQIKPLETYIDALLPFNTIMLNAYLSILENGCRVVKLENMTEVSYIVNPSYVEVMK